MTDLSKFQNSQEALLNEHELPNLEELGLTEDQIEILLTFAQFEGGDSDDSSYI